MHLCNTFPTYSDIAPVLKSHTVNSSPEATNFSHVNPTVGTISSASVFVFSVLSVFKSVVLPELSDPTHTIFAVGGLLNPNARKILSKKPISDSVRQSKSDSKMG